MSENVRDLINEAVKEFNDWTMFADGMDDAILGVESKSSRVIYSVRKCYEILMERDGMTFDEAEAFFAFNILSNYVGERTPIWCNDIFTEINNDD
jgi:hypothetical protein